MSDNSATARLRSAMSHFMGLVAEADLPDDHGNHEINRQHFAGTPDLAEHRYRVYYGLSPDYFANEVTHLRRRQEKTKALEERRGIRGTSEKIIELSNQAMGEMQRAGLRRNDVNDFQREICEWTERGRRLICPGDRPKVNDHCEPVNPMLLTAWTIKGAELQAELSRHLAAMPTEPAPRPCTRRDFESAPAIAGFIEAVHAHQRWFDLLLNSGDTPDACAGNHADFVLEPARRLGISVPRPMPEKGAMASTELTWFEALENSARQALRKNEVTTEKPTEAGYFSSAQLAERFGVDAEATRKALQRWREATLAEGGFVEAQDREPNEPKYLYCLARVTPVMESLRDRETRQRVRRMKTSGQRPAR